MALSADGRVVAFGSVASNLVPGDTNRVTDVFVRVLQAGTTPGPPSNLTAAVRGSNATFTWSPPTTGGPVATYVFHVGLNPGATNIDFATGGTGTIFEATNAPAGTYYVRVLARNSSGTSPPSNEVRVTVGPGGCIGPPGPPTGLRASVSGNLVTLTWSAPTTGDPATSYLLEAGTAPGASNVFVGNVGNVTSLTARAPTGTFFARVKGVSACGTGPASNEGTFTVP